MLLSSFSRFPPLFLDPLLFAWLAGRVIQAESAAIKAKWEKEKGENENKMDRGVRHNNKKSQQNLFSQCVLRPIV